MERLMDIYDQIIDPLSDEENFKKIIAAAYPTNNIYEKIQKINTDSQKKPINKEAEKKFFARNDKKYLENHQSSRMATTPSGRHKWQKVQRNNDGNAVFYHVYSRSIFNRDKEQENLKKTRHRLYVNIPIEYVHEFAMKFEDKCEKKGLPYYYKFSVQTRSDTFLIYSNTLYLDDYLEILREIKKENPELVSHTGKPPALAGKIDDWIGYGSEPVAINDELKANANKEGKKYHGKSFSSLRTDILSKVIKEETKNIIYSNLNTIITNKDGTKTTFKEYLARKLAKNALKFYVDKNLILSSKEREEDLIKKTIENIDVLIDGYFNNPEIFKRSKNPTYTAFFKPQGGQCNLKVDEVDFDFVFSEIMPKIICNSPKTADRIRNKIQEEYVKLGIDPKKTCFDIDIVNNIKKRDLLYKEKGGKINKPYLNIEPPNVSQALTNPPVQKEEPKDPLTEFKPLPVKELQAALNNPIKVDYEHAIMEIPKVPEDVLDKYKKLEEKIIFEEKLKKFKALPIEEFKKLFKGVQNGEYAVMELPKPSKDALEEAMKKGFKPITEEELKRNMQEPPKDEFEHAIMYNPNNNELRDMFASSVNDKENEGKRRIS